MTVFGSARFTEHHPYYEIAQRLGAALAHAGFTVMSGGGPGIMEAVSRGAKQAGGHAVGCNIVLPREQKPNPYLDVWLEFRYFFVRKLMLAKYSFAFVALPGGFGTLDEVFEMLTLIQTGKVKDFPVVLMGSDYWQPLVDFMRRHMVAAGTITEADIDRIVVSDSPEDIARHVREVGMREFGLTVGPAMKPMWAMGERATEEK